MGSTVSHGHREGLGEREAVIDEGMRRWYHACPCCLSAAYPEVKRALDEEKPMTGPATHQHAMPPA